MSSTIITISRQYGSGGREIGEKLAGLLGYAYYDRELLRRAAQLGNMDEELIRETDEGPLGRLGAMLSHADATSSFDRDSLPLTDKVFLLQFDTIRQIADEGPCVIVGQSAEYVLDGRPELFSVFVHADWEQRVARVMERNNITNRHEAEARIRRTDRLRASMYEQYTDRRFGDGTNFSLTLSSSFFGIDGAANLLAEIARGK